MDNMLKEITKQIVNYADNDAEFGWLTLVEDGLEFRFPKRALVWAVFKESLAISRLLPEYESFAGSGWKLPLDNSYHTDALLGAGIDLDDAYEYDSEGYRAWHRAVYEIDKEYRNVFKYDFIVLANTLPTDRKYITAMVYEHELLEPNTTSSISIFCAESADDEWGRRRAIVIPNGSAKYDLAGQHADIIISERGGPLCHMATVAREQGKLMIAIPDAVERFPRFTTLNFDLTDNTINLV